ncbi:hypothetical protein BC827DRAFT_1250230 [Russula dissimulans]|nr:hypothetical protein BC827DRAFT_1250230 [Russula dissimulans]
MSPWGQQVQFARRLRTRGLERLIALLGRITTRGARNERVAGIRRNRKLRRMNGPASSPLRHGSEDKGWSQSVESNDEG